jgi:hypothetical protein
LGFAIIGVFRSGGAPRRYLVIAPESAMPPGKAVQMQVE